MGRSEKFKNLNDDMQWMLAGELGGLPRSVQVIGKKVYNVYEVEAAKGESVWLEAAYRLPSGGSVPSRPAPGDRVIELRVKDPDDGRTLVSLSGLSLKFGTLSEGVGLTDFAARYAFWVSLLDGDITIRNANPASRLAELEVGKGGTARVTGNSGIDKLSVWHAKTVVFDGKGGSDTVSFLAALGDPYAGKLTDKLVVNLATGAGTNPYGGKLALKNVENVIGTAGADRITGSAAANVIGDPYDTGADVISAGAGDDIVKLGWANKGGAVVSGGAGTDELSFYVSDFADTGAPGARIVLDIANPKLNTFVFAKGRYTGIETFTAGSGAGGADTDIFVFRGGAAGETVTGTTVGAFVGPAFRAKVGRDELSGRGGDDVLKGLGGRDLLSGGAGDDWLVGGADADRLLGGTGSDTASYENAGAAVRASLAKPSTNRGDAKGDTYGAVENLAGSGFADTLAGNGGANRLAGKEGGDRLAGGAGKDVFVLDTQVFTAAEADHIADFSARDDQIALDDAIFAVTGGRRQILLAAQFKNLGSPGARPDADDRVLYNRKTGDLAYDADGSGKGAAVVIAHLDNNAALTAADFLVV